MSWKWLPNALTILRCLLAFVVGWAILEIDHAPRAIGVSSVLPISLFVIVALTDFIDGVAARQLDAVSESGAFIDPVADKLLVAISLLALSFISTWALVLALPAAIIITRDIYVTILRLNPANPLPVTALAKWKTAGEMAGIGMLLLSFAIPWYGQIIWPAGLFLIWVAALFSAYTGWLYARSAFVENPNEKRPRSGG